jgi:phage head maturation protease
VVDALRAWTGTGKQIPLHWNHSSDPAAIIGHVRPDSVHEVDGEVVAEGWVDQDTERGQQVWRLAKCGTLGFSFGYLIPDCGAVKRADGVREIHQLDVFEVSATAAPMNNGTRVLSTKAVDEFDQVRAKYRDATLALLTATDTKPATPSRKATAPIQIATFEC